VPISAVSVALMPARSSQVVFAGLIFSALAVAGYCAKYGLVSPLRGGGARIAAVFLSGMLVAQLVHTALLSWAGTREQRS
jgi:hypothetical protein